MKGYLLLLTLALQSGSIPAFAQPTARSRASDASRLEQQQTWVARGNALMQQSAFVEAYSAFLLAKSLGAPGMSDRMKTAQDQNLAQIRKSGNRLLFQASLQEARALAEDNLTQSLRLLHFVDTHAQSAADRAAVLRTLSEVTTNSDQWVYADRVELDPYQDPPPPLAATPDGRWFVFNQTLWQKRGSTYQKHYTFSPRGGEVQAVFSPKGNFLIFQQAKARADTLLRLDSASVKSRVALTPRTQARQYRFAADETYLLGTEGEQKPGLWQLSALALPLRLPLPGGLAEPVFSSEGHWLMAWVGEVAPQREWRETSDAVLLALTETGLRVLDTLRQVNDWRFIPGRRQLVSVSNDGIRRWTVGYDGLRLEDERTGTNAVYSLALCNADELIVRDDRQQKHQIYLLEDSLKMTELRVPDSLRVEFYAYASLEFSGDGKSLLTFRVEQENSGIVWKIEAGTLRKCHRFAHGLAGKGHYFSPDGRLLIVNYTGSVADSLWRINESDLTGLHAFGGQLDAERPSPSAWFSPNGRYLATHFQNNFQDVLWRVSERGLQAMTTFEDDLQAVEFLPGQGMAGLYFSPSSGEGMPSFGQSYGVLLDLTFQQTTLPPIYQFPQPCSLVRFSPGGRYVLAQAAAPGSLLTLFRLEAWFLSPVESLDRTVSEAVVSPDGRYVLLRGEAEGTETELWRCDEHLHLTQLRAFSGRFRSARFSPDSRFLLLDFPNSSNQLIALRDSLVELSHTFRPRFTVNGYRFSPDGRWLVADFTGSDADSLWRVTPQGLVPALAFDSRTQQLNGPSVDFTPDSRYLLTGLIQNEPLTLWELGQTEPVPLRFLEGFEMVNTLAPVKNGPSDSLTFLFSYFDVKLATCPANYQPEIRRLGHGRMVSPVYEAGNTLFFVTYSDLTRRKTLLGYDLLLREITVRRDVSNCLDVLVGADGTVRIAMPEGIQSMQAPRNVLQRIANGGVAPIAPELANRFSPR